MQDASGDSTLEAKDAFERGCITQNVTSRRYHADNGRFAETIVKSACAVNQQSLTFCGIGARHKNGVAEGATK